MIGRLLWACLLASWVAGCADGGGSPKTCRVDVVADLPLLAGRRTPTVEATLDGQKVALLIDTGAFSSTIAESAAAHFNLFSGPEGGLVRIMGIGGTVNARLVTVRHLGLGRGVAHDLELPVAGEFGGSVQGIPILGLFGADFLSNYEVDIDVPAHRFGLYALHDCSADIEPFKPPYFQVPFDLVDSRIELGVKLNDKPLTVVLDSGASITTVDRGDALQVGVTKEDLALDRAGHNVGIDQNRLAARLHRFGSLEIGDEQLRNFPFSVASLDVPHTLLGDDFFHFNRVWISYPRQRLYIQPALDNPIVRMAPPPAAAAAATP